MGKSSKPLRILAFPPVQEWKELEELSAQGHQVDRVVPLDGEGNIYDLILGPTCHLMDEQHRKYLTLAIAEGRRRRYRKET